MTENSITITPGPFVGTLGEFIDTAMGYFASNKLYRGYDQLVSLATSHDLESHERYQVTCDGALAGVAATELLDDAIRFNIFVVSPDFREVGVGDALFDYIVKREKYLSATHYESFALPGDRHTKNFFETRKGKARLLIIRGEIS